MLYFFKFILKYHKSRYAEALACLPIGSKIFIAKRQYALYRLGMYRSVLKFNLISSDWHSLYAQIVSSGASGDLGKLNSILESYDCKKVLKNKLPEVAISILPYSPKWSMRLFPDDYRSSAKVAALMKMGGGGGEAKEILDKSGMSSDPELFLLYSNLYKIGNEEQIRIVNNYLNEYNLSPLRLRSICKNFSPVNLEAGLNIVYGNITGPLVSIVMTAFRCAERIVYSINSLLQQTYKNIEIIVIDDNSDDDLDVVLFDLLKKDGRIRYERLPVNVGTYAAKTIGLQFARGDFVTCQDSDDWAHPQKIEMQMAPLLNDEKIIYTVSNLVRVQDDGVFYSRSVYPFMRLNASSVLFRKNVVGSKTGFWDLVRTGADSEFIARLRIVFGKHGVCKINKPLSFCAHRPDSLMTSARTGYNDKGFSSMRLEYWESFSKWHIETIRSGKLPKISIEINRERCFSSPHENIVSMESILRCIQELGLSSRK